MKFSLVFNFCYIREGNLEMNYKYSFFVFFDHNFVSNGPIYKIQKVLESSQFPSSRKIAIENPNLSIFSQIAKNLRSPKFHVLQQFLIWMQVYPIMLNDSFEGIGLQSAISAFILSHYLEMIYYHIYYIRQAQLQRECWQPEGSLLSKCIHTTRLTHH